MLSPNDTNDVALSRGGGGGATVTVTVKLQESVRSCASSATHDTAVDPTGKLDPLAGEHTVETGTAPLATTGAGYVTIAGAAEGTCADCAPGHVIVGGKIVGDGRDGSPQAAASKATKTAGAHRRINRLKYKFKTSS
jgi:hypothetical protein